jgi:hypothetical protein
MATNYNDVLDSALTYDGKRLSFIGQVLDGKVRLTIGTRVVDVSETVLQNAIEAAADGEPYTLNGKDKLILAITGTATERTVEFKVIGPGSVEGYVLGTKIGSDGSITLAASTSAITDEVWEFEGLAGYTSFSAKVTALTGAATVTVLGVA